MMTTLIIDEDGIVEKTSSTNLKSEPIQPQIPSTSPRTMSPKGSEKKLQDSVMVHNEKVRYYYNKTLNLRASVENMLEMLERMHTSTFAYLAQLPETGDYSVIGTLFELISTIGTMIEWRNLNHTCYWDDFCRETKQLMHLLEKVNGVALKCSDTATYILVQAQQLFKGLLHHDEKNNLKATRAIAHRQASDYVNEDIGGQNIQIEWKRPGDEITLSWHDPDGGLLSVKLKETGIGFRLRFLRHIIYHARSCLEYALNAFMKVNIILHLHIPIEKLERCHDVELKTLAQQEKAYLIKAKREFDSNLDKIWKMVSRFKYQAFHLLGYKATFKEMRKSQKYDPKTAVAPNFISLKLAIEDSLLMRVMSTGIQAQAKEESFDFTVYPDRTEDIIAIVEDLMGISHNGFQELQLSLAIVKSILPVERRNFSDKERLNTSDEISCVLLHRFQLRQSLKKSLAIFSEHKAFQKMDKLKLMTPVSTVPKKETVTRNEVRPETSSITFEGTNQEVRENVLNNNEIKDSCSWITLEGGVMVSIDAIQGVVTQCPFTQATKTYQNLSPDERVILAIRLVRHLLIVAANEQSWAKICYERVMETKSLVKRLKQKDRLNASLQNVILEQNKQIVQMLNLTKSMRFLRRFE